MMKTNSQQSGPSWNIFFFGWREPRSSDGGCWGFWVAWFFSKMFFRKGIFFWDHSEWPKPEIWTTIRSWTHKFLHMVLQVSTDGTDVSFWHGSITIKTQRDRTVSYSPISGGLKNREALNISVTNQQHWFSRKQSGHLVDFAFEDYLNSLMVHLLALWFHTLPQKNV